MPKKKSSTRSKGKGGLMSKLKALQGSWKKGKPRKAGFPIPDDDYGIEIISGIIEEARSSGRMQINWLLKVLEGDYESKEFHKYAGLETDDNIDFAMGDLETLELQVPDSIEDLGPVLEEASGLHVDCTVRTSDSFTNVDFNELLAENGEESEEEEEVEEEESEEEPEEEEAEEEAEEEEETETEEENEWPTEDEIKRLNKADLLELAKELDIKTKKFKGKKTGKLSTKKLAQACIDDIYEPEEA